MTLPVADARTTWKTAFALVRFERTAIFTSLLLYVLATGASLAPAWMVGRLIDSLPSAGKQTVIMVMIVLLLLLVVQTGSILLCRVIVIRLSERSMNYLRKGLIRDTLRFSPANLSSNATGELMTRSADDVSVLNNALRNAAPEVFLATVTVIVVGTGLIIVSPVMFLVCLVAVLLIGLPAGWALRRVRSRQLVERAAYGVTAESIAATVRGARTMEAFGLEEIRIRKLETALSETYTAAVRSLRLRQVLFPVIDGGMAVVLVSTLALGGLLHGVGLISLGEAATSLLLVRQISEPVATLVIWLQRFMVGGASLSRVVGVGSAVESDSNSRRSNSNDPEQKHSSDISFFGISPKMPALELHAIEHSYNSSPILRGIDLKVARGEFLAVVGASGSGKTTLGRLLCGIERADSGKILVHGMHIVDFPLEERRRFVLMVSQEQYIFHLTVAENLRMALPEATGAQILDALGRTGALNWVLSLKQGIDTLIGGNNFPITPEMAQRLALARALLAAPEILVLDEATSYLDPASARLLEEEVVQALPGSTIVAIAHQLHTAHRADRVVVFREGMIVEAGRHRDLVKGGGAYQRLWEDHLH